MEFLVELETIDSFCGAFWQAFSQAKVFAFHGEMGAGKTTLIAALCHYRGTKDTTGSPTFSIINEYRDGSGERIYHMDLYRLRNEEEVVGAGVEDTIYSGSTCMVEWPEKAPYLFDENSVHVYIEPAGEGKRRVRVEMAGA